MYLEHFNIKELPFTLTPNINFFCDLAGHHAAMNVLLLSLRNGEGFIKIVGEVGAGKTLLCRLLLENLRDDFITAYIPNPGLTAHELHHALALELHIPKPYPTNQHELLERITQELLKLHGAGKKVVLLLDEAQALPIESLEAIRLLTNLETKTSKLLQVVLFGQPELDVRLKNPLLRQLRQRIGFSYRLPPLSRADLDAYLCHRLAIAGYTLGSLFTPKASNLLYRKSQGLPRLINILCHKSMMIAYGRGEAKVNHKAMRIAIKDTESLEVAKKTGRNIVILSTGIALSIMLAIKYGLIMVKLAG